jgi:molybdenum cofactor cytidylyltransferase
MGTAKPALEFGDSTMLGTVVATARAAGLDPVVVVTGFHAGEVEAAVPPEAMVVRNPDPARGNMSSLLAGVGAIHDVDAVVVLLSDMPGVTVGSISAVCTALHRTGRMFSWTRYENGRGHPIAISSRAMTSIDNLRGTKALWPYFDALDAADYVEVVAQGRRPTDVNTPQEYAAMVDAHEDRGTLGP